MNAEHEQCQSCGMPLYTSSIISTNHDYCCFCFKDGHFAEDIEMDEMIGRCILDLAEFNLLTGVNLTKQEALKRMKADFPKFKRWSEARIETLNTHSQAINKALNYINENLTSDINIEKVAEASGLSPFHFHRIFKAALNENISEYIRRLRLEEVACKLTLTDERISDLVLNSGYSSKHVISKLFKNHFGKSPSEYRKSAFNLNFTDKLHDGLKPEIIILEDQWIAYIRMTGVYSYENYLASWKKLIDWGQTKNYIHPETEYIGIPLDNPSVTPEGLYRFYACFTLKDPVKGEGIFGVGKTKGGKYAVFTHKGSYKLLENTYHYIFHNWLPESGYCLDRIRCFEKYINHLGQVEEEKLITQIYLIIN